MTDSQLIIALKSNMAGERRSQAEFLAHLAEVDARRLYLPEHTSLFRFCTEVLQLSEANTQWSILWRLSRTRRSPFACFRLRAPGHVDVVKPLWERRTQFIFSGDVEAVGKRALKQGMALAVGTRFVSRLYLGCSPGAAKGTPVRRLTT